MFDSWETFAAFVESAQGNFFYNVLLLLILAVVSLVLQARAKPEKLDWRVNLALGSLLGLRFIMLAAYGLYWYSGSGIPSASAPIERTLHLVGLLLFAWIWSRRTKETFGRQAIMALSIVGIFALFLYITLPRLEAAAVASFNYTDHDYIWSAACVLVIIGGAFVAFSRGQAGLFGVMQMGLFFLGQVTHLLLAEPFGNMPLATEASNLLALPFLFFLPVKKERKEYDPGTEDLFPKEMPVYEMPEIGPREIEPPPRSQEAEDLAKQLAEDFNADVSALATMDQAEIQFHAGYNGLLDSSVELITMKISQLPSLAEALNAGQTLRLSSDHKVTDLETLVGVLKLSFPGNLLTAPIPNPRDNRIWFVALVRMNKPWQLKEEVNLQKSAEQISDRLIAAMGYLDDDLYLSEDAKGVADEDPFGLETTFPEPILSELNLADTDDADTLPDFLNERERLRAENERYKEDVERLLAHIDELETEGTAGGKQGAAHSAALVTALQLENDQLKSTLSSLHASQNRGNLAELEVDQAKEELRLALEQIAALQTQMESAQNVMSDAPQGQTETGLRQADVIASLAKELQQPLSSVTGYTDLLLGESVGMLGATQRKFLESVRASTDRMNTLVSDLLRLAKN